MTETIDKLYLELSLISKAKTKRELELEAQIEALNDHQKNLQNLLASAYSIAIRNGIGTAWVRFSEAIKAVGCNRPTPRTFWILPDEDRASQLFRE